MKLEAKSRLEAAAFAPTAFLKVLGQMTDAQLQTLATGFEGIAQWYYGKYIGKEADADLVVAAKLPPLELTINAMAWWTKNFAPIKKPPFLYRKHNGLHSVVGDRKALTVGGEVKVKPFRPVLSWSDQTKDVWIYGGWAKPSDFVMVMPSTQARIILSKRSFNAVDNFPRAPAIAANPLIAACVEAVEHARYTSIRFKGEHEYVVYHGHKPFTANVYGLSESGPRMSSSKIREL